MVILDPRLLFAARQLINGANVHRLKEMIFAYEQAVDLHNHHWGSVGFMGQICKDVSSTELVTELWLKIEVDLS